MSQHASKNSRKIGGRGRRKQQTCTRPPSSPSSSDHHSDDDSRRSQAESDASSIVSVVASTTEASVTSAPSQVPIDNQKALQNDKLSKRVRKKTPYSLEADEENAMLEFLQENPMLWDIKLTDFRMTDKKSKLWEDQAAKMGKTADYLRGWFKSLRDNYTRLDKRKSGDGVPDLTEREQWLKDNFSFLKTATRHRPEPVNSVKAIIDAHPGNLNAAEAACEELVDTDVDDRTPSPSLSIISVRKKKKTQEDDIIQSLQKSVNQSGELLKSLSEPQPVNERAAFGNYVRDSLLTMNKRKFKKVRSAINRVLTQAMDDDSENEDEQTTHSNVRPSMPPPERPFTMSTYLSQAPSQMYQPPPHMWRHKPPQASVWASATQEYVDQYIQQPLQPQQQVPPLQQEQTIMPQVTDLQQGTHQQSSSGLSAVLVPTSQVLNQGPNLSEL